MNEPLSGYYLVEQLGHNRYVGIVSEVIVAGAGFLRVDVPEVPAGPYDPVIPAFTKLISPGSLFAITPLTEDEAMSAIERIRAVPHNLTPAPCKFTGYLTVGPGPTPGSILLDAKTREADPWVEGADYDPYPRNSDGEFIADMVLEPPEVPDHDEGPWEPVAAEQPTREEIAEAASRLQAHAMTVTPRVYGPDEDPFLDN